MLIASNSLIDGFLGSNMMGQGIVVAQLLCSVVMIAAIIGKWKELGFLRMATRRFLRDFAYSRDVLDYYKERRPSARTGIVGIYRETAERLMKMLAPDSRALTTGEVHLLSEREVKLVASTCEHMLEEEEIRIDRGMGLISAVVAIAPMLGLLGTVWGVLDAFAEMGAAGSANLATIAPSISAALVTTVVGLLIAIPGVLCHSHLSGMSRNITSDMEGFADELTGRIACEYQGKAI